MSHRSSINVARALVKSFENTAYRRRDLIGLLRAEGWQLLGRGAFAAVMGHPDHPTVAIKVGQRTAPARRYRKITDGFLDYLDVTEDSRSKFRLKTYEVVRLGGRNDTYLVAMERCFKSRGRKAAGSIKNSGTLALQGRADSWLPKPDAWATRFLKKLTFLGGVFDLHGGNIMVRADGTPVITDPLIYRG